MHTLNPHFADAHAAERRERLLASPKRRRSPWIRLRRIGEVVAGRWVASARSDENMRRQHGRVLEA